MPDKFTDVEKAKKYLKDIKAHAFLELDKLEDTNILQLANINWSMGLRSGDINEVEFPDTE